VYNGIQSVDSPHNTLGGILSETGIVGFVPYVFSQCLLVVAFLRLKRKGGPEATVLWKYFLYVFLGYWISGLTLASGYSSDLNLWFMFVCMAMYKYAATGKNLRIATFPRNSGSQAVARPSMPLRASTV
jgi:O-antigen ligase